MSAVVSATNSSSQSTIVYFCEAKEKNKSEMPISELAPLFNNPKYSDVCFLVGSTRTPVFANRALLAAASHHFDTLLYASATAATVEPVAAHESVAPSSMTLSPPPHETSSSSSPFELPDIEAETFLALLKFIYCGDAALTSENVNAIVYSAQKYGIAPAQAKCEEFFERKLSDENALGLWEQALRYSLKKLADKCLAHICKRSTRIFQTLHHLKLSREALVTLLQRDDLNAREILIFQAVIQWLEERFPGNKEEQNREARVFMPYLRFSAISAKDLINHVFSRSGLFSSSEQLQMLSEKVLNDDKLSNCRHALDDLCTIKENISYDSLIKEGWKVVYDHAFSHSTTIDELLEIGRGIKSEDSILCCAAKRVNSDEIALCAFGKAKDILKENGEKTRAVKYGEIYWYLVREQSFGFAESDNISLNSADTVSGNLRMSWHLSGGGGYRVGESKDLNGDDKFIKLLLIRD